MCSQTRMAAPGSMSAQICIGRRGAEPGELRVELELRLACRQNLSTSRGSCSSTMASRNQRSCWDCRQNTGQPSSCAWGKRSSSWRRGAPLQSTATAGRPALARPPFIQPPRLTCTSCDCTRSVAHQQRQQAGISALSHSRPPCTRRFSAPSSCDTPCGTHHEMHFKVLHDVHSSCGESAVNMMGRKIWLDSETNDVLCVFLLCISPVGAGIGA